LLADNRRAIASNQYKSRITDAGAIYQATGSA
jgi:hypothetical protein